MSLLFFKLRVIWESIAFAETVNININCSDEGQRPLPSDLKLIVMY